MTTPDSALPDPALEELLNAVEPETPDVATAQRMLRRIRSRIDAPEPIRTVRRDVGWTTVAPGIERKILFDDGSTMSWLVRLAPGADLPEHVHEDGAEECLIVEGEMCLNGECYRAGDYMVAAPGSRHMQTRTTTGATMFLRTPSPGRSAATGAGRG